MSIFKKYSDYYDLLYADKNYKEEAEYVHSLIQQSFSGAKSILNIGCGTGKHDFEFAKLDYEGTGIDLSEEMISIANENNIYPSKLQFLQGDARNIVLNKKFDVVVSLFHVASYQTTNEDFENYLKTAYNHLEKGGLFIFDFWYGPSVLTDKPATRIKRLENKDLKLTRISEPTLNVNENVVEVNFEILIEGKSNAHLKKIREKHKIRYWFLPELLFILEKNNFSVNCQYKWMTENKLSLDSWYGVLVVSK